VRSRAIRFDKLARIYDDEILPVWAERFGRMLLRDLVLPPRCQVLDVACGTGYPAVEIVRRMGDGSRLIALDSSSAMLDVARRKMTDMGAKGVFFRTENADSRLSFADDVYDVVVCNLGVGEMSAPRAALTDFARVTKPGGDVRCTLPVEGSFQEFFDIYREVLTKHDKHELLARLDEHVAAVYPTVARCERWLAGAGLVGVEIEIERFTMLFRSSREFFFAPVIEYGPLPEWKALAGKGQEMQDVFWYIKEAIDAYFADRAFEVTVVACCLRGKKPGGGDASEIDFGELDRDPDGVSVAVPVAAAMGEDGAEEIEDLIDTDSRPTDPHGDRPRVAEPVDSGPYAGRHWPATEADDDDGEVPDEPLDAFVDGKRRPPHLDDGRDG
jgi:ubiquinone/menaquinone biosynthesis C-methylase UbiE